MALEDDERVNVILGAGEELGDKFMLVEEEEEEESDEAVGREVEFADEAKGNLVDSSVVSRTGCGEDTKTSVEEVARE